MNSLKQYFSQTHRLLYSYLLAVPLLILYEVLVIISQPDSRFIVRNAVDMWFKSLMSLILVDVFWFTLILALVFGMYVFYKERGHFKELRQPFFLLMMLESVVYAVLGAFIAGSTVGFIFNQTAIGSNSEFTFLQEVSLSLGAGLYEELFFRVILVSVLLVVFKPIFQNPKARYTAAIFLAAVLFSAVHYIGAYGDQFLLSTFIYRLVFGLFLNAIYAFRGFGVAAWSHAIYDLMVIAAR